MAPVYATAVALLASIASASTTGASNAAAAKPVASRQFAGAVFNGPLQYEGLVNSAFANLTVPHARLPTAADHHQVYEGSAAVGMYGYNCTSLGFLSAGVTWSVSNTTVKYSAFLSNASYPAATSSVTVSAGDLVGLFVQVYGAGGHATASIENYSTGESQELNYDVFYPSTSCARNAEWVVFDPTVSSKPTPFAAFQTVNFTDAAYTVFDPVNGLQDRGLTNVTALNLVNGADAVLAAGTLPVGGSTVQVTYKKSA